MHRLHVRAHRRPALLLLCVVAAGCGVEPSSPKDSPFAVEVIDFQPGEGAGFGQDRFPDVVLGPPRGGGERSGSLDVLSLGRGGAIVLRLGRPIRDIPGPDLIVFENPFRFGGGIFAEPGEVAVSEDGAHWTVFSCDPTPPDFVGCAGVRPVLAHAGENERDPTDPERAGGDPFDMAVIGVASAHFVRIRDVGAGAGFGPPSEGFDLDAVAVVAEPSNPPRSELDP